MKILHVISILLLSTILFAGQATAQWDGDLRSVDKSVINLAACKLNNYFGSVAALQIADMRPDTNCIGFEGNFNKEAFVGGNNIYAIKNCSQLVTEGVFISDLKNLLSGRAAQKSADPGFEIKLVLREFWINDFIKYYDKTNYINGDIDNAKDLGDIGGIIIKADVLLVRGNQFIPLKQFDTLMSLPKYVRKAKMDIISAGLDALIASINLIPLAKYHNSSKRSLTALAIDSFYASTLYQPLIFTSPLPKEAVFNDAIALRNIQPSTTRFIVEKGKRKETYIYDTTAGNHNQIFPFSYIKNGNLYILTNHVYCNAYKIGKRFYMYAPKITMRDSHTNIAKMVIIGSPGSSENKIVPVHQFLMYDPLTSFFW